uniref:Tc1-like transposase DDE domain-containing protein n=1 Tax=Eptatretus burgeri TaxID=7764 RepID=A0A8C4N7D9_EPTBU
MSPEECVRRRNVRRKARRETRRVLSQLFLKQLQEMDSSNLTKEENDYNGCLDNGNYNTLLPNQGQKQDNVLEGLNGQMHCTPMLQTGKRGNDNTVTEYDESDIQDEPACPAGPEGTSSNQSKAAMNSGHSFESPATAEVGIEEEGDWQGSMGEHAILHEAEVIDRVVAEKLHMKSILQGEEASLGTSHEDQNLDRHQGEGKTSSLPLNTLERSAEEHVRERNMRKNARHDARRVTHQAFLKRLLEMDSSNLANEEHDYVGCLDNDNYDMLVPNQGQKQNIVLEYLNGQMHCTPILQAETRKNDKTVTEFHKSDIHREPASQAEPGGSSSQPSSNPSKAAMNSGHSFENPATAEGEEASLGTSHEDQNLDRNQSEGKTSNLLLNTWERTAEKRVRGRNMRKNARHDARRVTHQAFLKRLQQMDSSKRTEEENDGNDFLDNDNFHILVANQGQEEDNVLEDLNGQMHCTPILQTGMRRNDKTVTEYDKNDIQGEPASQADPEGTSSQPLSNRSKAAMNSGHSFENPATAEGGSEEEEDGQGSMEENEMLHEADAIDRIITEKLGMKFMLQGEEFSLDTSDEENDLYRIDDHVDGCVHVRCLPGEVMAPGCTVGRRQAGGGSVMVWAMFYWETLRPAIHVDVNLTHVTYRDIVANQVHPFMAMVFPDGSGLFQQDNTPCHTAHNVQEWFEEHDEVFTVLPWPPNSPDPNPIEHLWDVLD